MQLPMIRIPDAIEIGGVTYVVKFVDEMPHGQVAQIHFLEGVITIEESMNPEVTFVSFIHEIVHGAMQSQNHFPNEMVYNDENFIERTAQIMTSVFKQIYDYNMLYDDYFAPQTGKENDILNIEVDEVVEL